MNLFDFLCFSWNYCCYCCQLIVVIVVSLKNRLKKRLFGEAEISKTTAIRRRKWEPVLAMNGKRVARKGMRIQAKEIVRKQKIEATRQAKCQICRALRRS